MSNSNNKPEAPASHSATTLRSRFCDAPAGSLADPAQQAATEECQHPRQSRPFAHEPFEPHGMN